MQIQTTGTGMHGVLARPPVWGPAFWRTLHLVALGYPERPSPDDASGYRAFFAGLGSVIPCGTCAANYARHIREVPMTDDLFDGSRRDALFDWTVRLHNLVNAELGKRADWSATQARQELLRLTPVAATLAAGGKGASDPEAEAERRQYRTMWITGAAVAVLLVLLLVVLGLLMYRRGA
jgi:hypothetical protein